MALKGSATPRFLRGYTFVDYATQAYQVIIVALILGFHNHTVPGWHLRVAAHAAGVLVAHLLIRAYARGNPSAPVTFLRHFYPILYYTWFFTETGALNRMFIHEYLDPQVIRCEQAVFGFQPSLLFMQKLPWLAVSEIFYASYFSYYLMIFGVGLALFLRDRAEFFRYLSVISFVFYVCYLIYIFVPVIGPRVFLREIAGYSLPDQFDLFMPDPIYPEAVRGGLFFKVMAWIYRTFEAPGAAMPSSHVAIALTTVYFSFRALPKIRHVHLGVAVLLCLSTVYCRYHYALDVIGGVLTAAILLPIGNRLHTRYHDETCEGAGSQRPQHRRPHTASRDTKREV